MVFPILGGNSAVGGYAIDNSLRFNDDDNAYLSKTLSASPTNQKIVSFSFWAKRGNLGVYSYNLVGNTSAPYVVIGFLNDDTFSFQLNAGSGSTGLITTAKYRDTSAWYHMLCVLDTTQATSSNRLKIYINGIQITDFGTANYPTQDTTWNINTNVEHGIGGSSAIQDFDGYMAEVHFIDGQALSPTDFGEFDEDSGIWKPIRYSGSYGTNGFYLDFENSGSLGADQSGNGNDFTPTNLASTDQTTDTPTNNFATGNPLARSRFSNQGTISEGNLKYNALSNDRGWLFSSQGISQGKWYWEVKITAIGRFMVGVGYESVLAFNGTFFGNNPSKAFSILDFNGNLYYDGTNTSYGSSLSVDDIVMVALDMDNHLCWFGKNGTWFDSAIQSEIENSTATNDATTQMGTQQNLNSGEPVFPFMTCQENGQTGGGIFNFGNPPFSISSGNSDDNGYGNFEYEVPTGYLSLCSANLATALSPTIDDGSAYFQATTYTGDGNDDRQVTNSGNSDLQPDWIWVKNRSDAFNHILQDTSRGLTTGGYLASNQTQAESGAITVLIKTATSNGFTVGTSGAVNANTNNLVAWQWKANAGSTSSNTDGSITSTVQANTTAGFSIVTYTGNSTNSTIGHGLGVAPSFYVTKNRTQGIYGWVTYHQSLGATKGVFLNTTGSQVTDSTLWNNTEPTSSVISLGSNAGTNNNAQNYVMYAFAEIEGYSKFGSYTGNGSTDGTFVYTGFRPAFVIIKVISTTENWVIRDNKRDPYNNVYHQLLANATSTEDTTNDGRFSQDFLSNGFKIRASHATTNQSGQTYIYMAFAENPFVSSTGIPVTAR